MRLIGFPVLVLLPPSETKRDGGDGAPLRLEALSHPALDPVREQLVDELVELARDPAAARAALGLTEAQHAEIARNAALWSSPTAPAPVPRVAAGHPRLPA